MWRYLIILGLAAAGPAARTTLGQQRPGIPPEHQRRANRLKALWKELVIENNEDAKRVTPGYAEAGLSELRGIVQQEVLDFLDRSDDLDALRTDLRELVGGDKFGRTQSPFVFRAGLQGIPSIVTGFSWPYGPGAIPHTRAIIDGYSKKGLRYELADQAGDGLECDLHMVQLNSPRPNEIWFLADGSVIGATRLLSPLRIYSFDGYRFEVLWDAGELVMDPSYNITKDAVTLTYWHDSDRDHEFRDVIALTSSGLVVSTVEIK